MNKNKTGYTLIELLVVILIIGVIAAASIPYYMEAVERSRMAEVVNLVGSIAEAQQRRYMNVNRYSEDFRGMDVTLKGGNGSAYYTQGDVLSGDGGNGFVISLSGTNFINGLVTAKRYAPPDRGELRAAYQIERYYVNKATACRATPGAGAYAMQNGSNICADFCGIDYLDVGNYCCNDGTSEAGGTAIPTGGCTPPVIPD